MQLAFINLTPVDRPMASGYPTTTELWVNVSQISQVGVSDGFTFVETATGCSWVTETPREVLEKVASTVKMLDGDWDDPSAI